MIGKNVGDLGLYMINASFVKVHMEKQFNSPLNSVEKAIVLPDESERLKLLEKNTSRMR